MNSTKSIIILIGLCFFQISHAVEKGIITKDKAGFVTSMRFPGNDKGETTVTPKEFFMEVLNVDPSEHFMKRLGTRRDIECYDQLYKGVPVIGGGYGSFGDGSEVIRSGGYVFGDRNPKAVCQDFLDETGFPVEVPVPTTYSIGILNPVIY